MMKRLILSVLLMFLCATGLSAKVRYVEPAEIEAIKHKIAIFKDNPSSADARFEMAMAYGYNGFIERGWKALKKVPESYAPNVISKYKAKIEEDPQEWRHHFKLAFGYYFQEKPEEAIKSFEKVLEIEPDQVWAMGFIALILGTQKKNAEAIELCKKALKIEPNATAIHFLLAEGYRRQENYFGAMSHLMIVGRLKTEEALFGDLDFE